MRWQTLLVPHDYSPCADRALALAAELARHHGAKIVLLHVTHIPPGLTADSHITDRAGNLVRVDDYANTTATRELDARAQNVRDTGLEVKVAASIGHVSEEILRVAEEIGADAIVMGTHGRTGLAQVFLGSMAEKVLRQAKIPVVTVREKTDPRRVTADVIAEDMATD
jgi:nucleotide-binding universal stress UspA family protein